MGPGRASTARQDLDDDDGTPNTVGGPPRQRLEVHVPEENFTTNCLHWGLHWVRSTDTVEHTFASP